MRLIVVAMLLALPLSVLSCSGQRNRTANRILKKGMYPPLPPDASVEVAEWDNNWVNSFGLVPTAHLRFSAPTSTVAAWINSVQTQRSAESPYVLQREEQFRETEGWVEIRLLMSNK